MVRTKKISRLVNLSSEQFRQELTAEQVSQSVARDLTRKADASYIGDVSNPVGLINIPGTVSGGNVFDSLDSLDSLDNLIELIATLESNGATPSAIVLDPHGWASFRTMKIGTNYNATLLGAGTEDAVPMLLNLPVLRSRFIPAYTGLVIDSAAVVSAVGPVQVAVSEYALFSRDAVQLRAAWRIGWGLTRPQWLGKFSLEPGS